MSNFIEDNCVRSDKIESRSNNNTAFTADHAEQKGDLKKKRKHEHSEERQPQQRFAFNDMQPSIARNGNFLLRDHNNHRADIVASVAQRQKQICLELQSGRYVAASSENTGFQFGSNDVVASTAALMKYKINEEPQNPLLAPTFLSLAIADEYQRKLLQLHQLRQSKPQETSENLQVLPTFHSTIDLNQTSLVNDRRQNNLSRGINEDMLKQNLHSNDCGTDGLGANTTTMNLYTNPQRSMAEYRAARDLLALPYVRCQNRYPTDYEVLHYIRNVDADFIHSTSALQLRQEELLQNCPGKYCCEGDYYSYDTPIQHLIHQQVHAESLKDDNVQSNKMHDGNIRSAIHRASATICLKNSHYPSQLRKRPAGEHIKDHHRSITNPNQSQTTEQDPSIKITTKTAEVHSDTDIFHLSKYQCNIRTQLEFFASKPEDAAFSVQGRKKKVRIGQVGIRCRHCSHLSHKLRGRGAIYYPVKLSGVYQVVQNMATVHLINHCSEIKPDIREKLKLLRGNRDETVTGGGKYYWTSKCTDLGILEYKDGLFFTGI